MRKSIIMTILLMIGLAASAQETTSITCATKLETIETFAANYHDPEWYGAQALAWQKVVDEQPADEWAWRNLFRATYYHEQFTDGFGNDHDQSKTADVLRKMEAMLPDSYVLNLSKGRFCLSSDSAALRGDNIFRAIELMPEDANCEDVDYLTCRLWLIDPENSKIAELNKRIYKQGYFPERILRYNWNMLQSMEPNALYFANGDNITKPMKMLQDALDLRLDVAVIPMSFLYSDKFREALFRRLDIKPMKVDLAEYAKRGDDWGKQFYADMMTYLIHESKRPAYFFTDVLTDANLNTDSIYNEGLLLKWSDHQYDNFAVAMHNVKEVYHLDYLAEPDLHPNTWEASDRLDLSNVFLLSNLVPKLWKKGDTSESNHLYKILEQCINRCAKGEQHKMLQQYLQKESQSRGDQ
ncbi:MAG: hypothetical protein Q4F34_08940 [Prevotellaceae bacterium]|nr:hypothetical protein [Prevotellaceae bacterium]